MVKVPRKLGTRRQAKVMNMLRFGEGFQALVFETCLPTLQRESLHSLGSLVTTAAASGQCRSSASARWVPSCTDHFWPLRADICFRALDARLSKGYNFLHVVFFLEYISLSHHVSGQSAQRTLRSLGAPLIARHQRNAFATLRTCLTVSGHTSAEPKHLCKTN